MQNNETRPFWQRLSLQEMSREQWESLCDGCGKCCLQKLEDEDTGDIYYTRLVCQYMTDSCQCSVYTERQKLVPNCLWLTPADLETLSWLPDTCAYRRLGQGQGLPDWHPLVTRDPDSTRTSGNSVQQWPLVTDAAVPEDEWEDHILFKVG